MPIGLGAVMDNSLPPPSPVQRAESPIGGLPERNFIAPPEKPEAGINATPLSPVSNSDAAQTRELEQLMKELAAQSAGKPSDAKDIKPPPPANLSTEKQSLLDKVMKTEGLGKKVKIITAAILGFFGFNIYKGIQSVEEPSGGGPVQQ